MEIPKVTVIMTIQELKVLREFLGSLSDNDQKLIFRRTEKEIKILDQIYLVLADVFTDD
jgi:hypothetical protein